MHGAARHTIDELDAARRTFDSPRHLRRGSTARLAGSIDAQTTGAAAAVSRPERWP